MAVLRGHTGSLSIRPPREPICYAENHVFSCLPTQTDIAVMKLIHNWLSTAVSLWGHRWGQLLMLQQLQEALMTSPPPKPRSLRKVRPGAAILRQKTLFLFPLWGVSSQLQEPNSVCVPGDVKRIVLALLTLQVLHSWDTTQSARDGGRGGGVQL